MNNGDCDLKKRRKRANKSNNNELIKTKLNHCTIYRFLFITLQLTLKVKNICIYLFTNSIAFLLFVLNNKEKTTLL